MPITGMRIALDAVILNEVDAFDPIFSGTLLLASGK
jgi:hypothetical protein